MSFGFNNYLQFILAKKIESYLNHHTDFEFDKLSEKHLRYFSSVIRNKFRQKFSLSTLKRMLREKTYDFNRTDERVVNNLNLVAKQLKYKNWMAFIKANIGSIKTNLRNVTIDKSEIQQIALVIERATKAEYDSMKNLPGIDISELKNYYVNDDSYLQAFLEFLSFKQTQSAYLFVPSSFYKLKIVNVTFIYTNAVVVFLKLQSALFWKHTPSHTNIEITDFKTSKILCVHKIQGHWYISSDLDFYFENEGVKVFEISLKR
jgi:hypothetical protein